MLGMYFARRFLWSFFRVGLVISGLLFLGDFLENLKRYSSMENGVGLASKLAAMQIPSLIAELLPVIVALAGISFSIGLARSNEFVISRAAGISALRSLAPSLLTAFAIGVVAVMVFNPIAGTLQVERDRFKNSLSSKQSDTVSIHKTGYWVRQSTKDGHMTLHADQIQDNGQGLRNVTALNFDDKGKTVSRHFAPVALLKNGEWILTNGRTWFVDKSVLNPEAEARDFSVLRIPTTITPDEIVEGFPKAETQTLLSLRELIYSVEEAGLSSLPYLIHFQSELARPLLLAAMLAVGVMFTLQTARLGNLGFSVVLALASGFGLHFLQNFAKTLGEAGEIPVFVAAWFPALVGCFIAVAVFLHLEDG